MKSRVGRASTYNRLAMPLAPGTKLGSYEVLGPLGAGGMGEVYRARDSRLNRDLALKVLPAGAAGDAERRDRFQREAQVVAALNHPNIVTIYSVEEDAGTFFLTMELVEGKTLSESLPKSGLPLARVLAIGIDVADAMAAAHQKGVTPRDLTPSNIMLGEGDQQGRVKVLDFGLAKLDRRLAGADSRANLATALVTGEGRILGTVAYMAPEQAEGKTIDARSDLFSLGVVLYETATGRRPFEGETSVSILSSIMKDTPASVTDVNPSLPREFGRIIRRTLAKDPEARYQTAKDLRNDLKELRASLESGELSADTRATAQAPARSGAVRLWQGAAIVAALAAIVAIAYGVRRDTAHAPATASTSPIEMERLTSGVNASRPALSPDGKFVAYVQTSEDGQYSVWVRQIATSSNVQIVPAEPGIGIFGLAVTPDGSFVDFLRWRRTRDSGDFVPAIWRVPLLGGPARQIVDRATSPPAWSPDGKQMVFLTQDDLGAERSVVVADAEGARPRVVPTRRLPLRYMTVTFISRPDVRPVWFPDGLAVLVLGSDERDGLSQYHLVKVDVASGAETGMGTVSSLRTAGLSAFALAPDGRSALMSVVAETGDAPQIGRVHLPDGAMTRLTADLSAYLGVSHAGDRLVTTQVESRMRLWVGDAAWRSAGPVGAGQASNGLDATIAWTGPDRIVFASSLSGGVGAWAMDVRTAATQLITPRASRVQATRDGQTIVFRRGAETWRANSDGTRASHIPGLQGVSLALVPDGSGLFHMSDQSGLQTAWTAKLDGGSNRQFADVRVSAFGIAVSRDSRFVALITIGPDGPQTLIYPVGGGAPVHLPSLGGGGFQWTPDGLALAAIDSTGRNIWIQPIDGSPGRWLTSFTDQRVFAFGWSQDGKRLAMFRGTTTSDIVLLQGVK